LPIFWIERIAVFKAINILESLVIPVATKSVDDFIREISSAKAFADSPTLLLASAESKALSFSA